MASGTGCAERFTCPYHGWTYSLDGRLEKATRLGGIKDFKPKDNGLVPIRVQTWGHLIFAQLGSHLRAAPAPPRPAPPRPASPRPNPRAKLGKA